jgi:hypothetical protein
MINEMQTLFAITKRRDEMKKVLMVLMMLLLLTAFVSTKQVYAAAALTDEGAILILDTVFSDQARDTSVTLKLFCTNVTPIDTTTYTSYTWCTGGGYADKTLTVGAGWTPSGTAPPQAAYAQQDFLFTGDLTTNVTIYGYCLCDSGSTKTYGCEQLTSPFTPHNGYHLYITPIIKLSTGTPS